MASKSNVETPPKRTYADILKVGTKNATTPYEHPDYNGTTREEDEAIGWEAEFPIEPLPFAGDPAPPTEDNPGHFVNCRRPNWHYAGAEAVARIEAFYRDQEIRQWRMIRTGCYNAREKG